MRLPIEIELASDESSIPDARRMVAGALRAGAVDEAVTADLLVVVSELVSNAVTHGGGGAVGLAVRDAADCIEVTVVSDGTADVGPVPSWIMPPPGSVGGRGLALVRALSDRVDAASDGDRFAVTASRRRH
jgi:anti-sigma regulatory factor (Ser/Thr protein kinase)